MSAGYEHGIPEAAAPQLRTILLTDLVDSTGLVERLGDVPASELFREHDRLVLELQQRWRGRLIDRSDGLLLLFERAIDGLGFALDYTKGLREIGKARGVPVQARSGLHVGEVLTWKNSEAAVQLGSKPLEVEGLAKPMAARLMTMARPGQILISAMAEPLARRAARELGARGQNLLWKSYGRWRFKGIPQAHEIHEVGEVGIAPLRMPASGGKARRDIPLWRRPAALVAEVVLLAGIGVGGWMATRSEPAIAFAERDWVVVADLRNLTGQSVLDDSLEQAFRISLEQSRYVNVLSDTKARDTLARMQLPADTQIDRSVASEIAIRDGARAVILPTVSEVGGRLRVSAEVIDPHSQATVYAESSDGTGTGSLLGSIDEVTGVLRERLGEALATVQRDSAPLPQVTTSNLDALRAYALGQAAFGSAEYEDAISYYGRAVQLDERFALAYIGLLRSHNAADDLANGVPYLRKAVEHRKQLPARDQLYLDAWIAQVHAPSEAVDKWRQMFMLYPDFFPAATNTGYGYYEDNRFAEAMRFTRQATASQYEFVEKAWDLMGMLSLALGRYEDAERQFLKAGADLGRPAAVRLANTYAAQGNFEEAERASKLSDPVARGLFDVLTLYIDQGRLAEARKHLEVLQDATPDDTRGGRALLLPTGVLEWMEGNEQAARATLGKAAEQALEASRTASSNARAFDELYLALSAALLSQRLGDREVGAQLLEALRDEPRIEQHAPVAGMFKVLQANHLRLDGKAAEAIALLEPLVDGTEPQQLHWVLMEAYSDEERLDKALEQARWISAHRGRAYIELGCGWCHQAVNVVDTTLARLRAAELLAQMQREEESSQALLGFDRQWKTATLPDHLRLRRAAVLGTFN